MASISTSFLQDVESRVDESDVAKISGEGADLSRATVTVMIVEDQDMVADMYDDWVSDAGYRTAVAYGGRQALEQIDGDVDVVFLDRRMPVITGDEVLQVIRSEDIQDLDPEAFVGADPDKIHAEIEKNDVEDIDVETAQKLNAEIVRNVQTHDIDPQICMVTAVDPGFEIVDLDFEHYITKEIDPDELIEIADALTVLEALEENVQEYQSLRWKEILLMEEMDSVDLETDERYQRLQRRMEELERDAGKLIQAIKSIDQVPGS